MAIPRIKSYPMPSKNDLPENKMDWAVDPKRAVLLIHDTQEYFVNFYQRELSPVKEMIENILKIAEKARKLGIPVAYTAQLASQTLDQRGLLQPFWGAGIMGKDEEEQIIPPLAMKEGDILVDKWRYSAFKSNSFDEIFTSNNRDQLIICGLYGHIGCLTTANEAFMNDIEPFLVGDAIADFSEDDHKMAMKWVTKCCGMVKSTELILDEMSKKSAEQPNFTTTTTFQTLHSDVAAILDMEMDEIYPDDNLIYTGLDSVRLMALSVKWAEEICQTVTFSDLAECATLEEWASIYDKAVQKKAVQNV